ncbi:hypothetical protein [Oceanobacillus senegalensis]|nr:hypothetical protein [Oceanobacillus senegalensis]
MSVRKWLKENLPVGGMIIEIERLIWKSMVEKVNTQFFGFFY